MVQSWGAGVCECVTFLESAGFERWLVNLDGGLEGCAVAPGDCTQLADCICWPEIRIHLTHGVRFLLKRAGTDDRL